MGRWISVIMLVLMLGSQWAAAQEPLPPEGTLAGIETVVLRVEDLPRGFEALALAELGFTPRMVFLAEYSIDTDFVFKVNTGQMVMGFGSWLDEPGEQDSFDGLLRGQNLELLTQTLSSGFKNEGGTFDDLEMLPLDPALGEVARGYRFSSTAENSTLLIEVIAFRRGEIGIYLINFDDTKIAGEVDLAQLAALLDQRSLDYAASPAANPLIRRATLVLPDLPEGFFKAPLTLDPQPRTLLPPAFRVDHAFSYMGRVADTTLMITGAATLLDTPEQVAAFDAQLSGPNFLGNTFLEMTEKTTPERATFADLTGIGQIQRGIILLTDVRQEAVAFRQGEVGVMLYALYLEYPAQGQLDFYLPDFARIIDQRILEQYRALEAG